MRQKKYRSVLAVVLFAVLVAALALVWRSVRPSAEEGEKAFTVEVFHKDGSTAEFSYATDAEYLGGYLLEEGLIAGDEGAYGLFVDTVDGETADFSEDEGWWKLACDGEDSTVGVDQVPIRDGSCYTWSYTTG